MDRKSFLHALSSFTASKISGKIDELKNFTGILPGSGPMPVLFLGHGSPMNAIGENPFVRGWKRVGLSIPKPKAILCISAHWETGGTFVTSIEKPGTIHDFGSFPQELFEVEYPAPGSPELAAGIISMVTATRVGSDLGRGLDHGCWSLLKQMYPAAGIPVVQMSIDATRPAQDHYDLAKELAPLREKGVLIIGSGNLVHNMSLVAWEKIEEPEYGFDWAFEADAMMKKLILAGDHRQLIVYQSLGKSFGLAVPTPEHYLPLLYVMALRGEEENVSIFNDKIIMGSLSMTSLKIG